MQIQTSYRKPISTEIKTANNTFKYFSFSSQPTKDSLNFHQLRLSSAKKNTISGESISETSALCKCLVVHLQSSSFSPPLYN